MSIQNLNNMKNTTFTKCTASLLIILSTASCNLSQSLKMTDNEDEKNEEKIQLTDQEKVNILYKALSKDNHPLHELIRGHICLYAVESSIITTTLEKLIENTDINEQDPESTTPLLLAVLMDNFQFSQILLQHGADTNIQYKSGDTPLHFALARQNWQIAKLLATKTDTTITNNSGKTPYDIAVERGCHDQELLELLRHTEEENSETCNIS